VINPQLSLTKEQYIGRSDFDIGLSKKEADHLTSIKRKVLETGNPLKVEVPLKNLSGNTEYFDGSLIPRYDSNGKVNGLLGYFRNVTEQKKSNDSIKDYQKKLLSLTRHLEEVRENERAQIAMNLHDDLGQRLTSLNLDLGWMKSRMGVQSQGLRKKMEEMSRSIIETIESIKEVSSFLRPSILYELGLIPAFTWQVKKFEKQSGLKCHFTFMPEEFRIDDHIALIIYRVLQESLTNIIRHSEASSVEVVLNYKKSKIELTIKDNGVGIDNNKVNSITSMGIAGLMERVRSVSGTLSVVGVKGTGTTIIASIPLKKKKNHD
jgi:signal transduction histidine kinase